jgi:hypothetical protein
MMEDFWMPRREGGKGTEITTLPGGQNLGEIQDIEYFQQKLYHSLNVPISRLQQQQGFSIGRSQEISRDEVKFNKFIVRLRKKFNVLFNNALRVQLIAKGVIRPDEWDDIRTGIKYDYIEDNNYSELRDSEIMQARLAMLPQIDPFVGKYYSMEWVRKNVLHLDDKEIQDIDKQIEAEHELRVAQAEQQGQVDGTQQATTQELINQAQMQQQPDAQQAGAAQADQAEQQDASAQDGAQDNTQDSAPKQTKSKPQTGVWPN